MLGQRYRALWDLERVLYQRFRYSDGGVTGAADESLVNQLHEQVWGLGFGVWGLGRRVPRESLAPIGGAL